jgi:hypothetical protein
MDCGCRMVSVTVGSTLSLSSDWTSLS